MAKDAFYFSHDCNARNDAKLIPVRMSYGMQGYGIFFGIVEMLREANGYQLPTNFQAIAFDLREDAKIIENVVMNYNLFTVDAGMFWSESLKERMRKREEVSMRRRQAGKIGGAMNALSKAKRPMKGTTPEFEKLWLAYPAPIGKKMALKAFHASVKAPQDHLDIWTALNNYKASKKVADGFIQNGSTWFNNWRDWINLINVSADGIPEEWKSSTKK